MGGGKRGACRVEHGAFGSVVELPGVSEVVCQQACELLPECLAIDYSVGPEKMCELHKEPVLHVLPMGEHACRVKPAPGQSVFHTAILLTISINATLSSNMTEITRRNQYEWSVRGWCRILRNYPNISLVAVENTDAN